MSLVLPDHLTCKELVELVTSYLEGQLSPADRARFEVHTTSCGACVVYYDQMRRVVRAGPSLLDTSLAPEASAPLLAAFRGWKQGKGGG